jgi:hypothetical protein
MPLFYFDTDDGDRQHGDDEGQDLPDAEAARRLAMATLPRMADDHLPNGDSRVLTVRVRDAQGTPIYAVELAIRGEWLITPPEAKAG